MSIKSKNNSKFANIDDVKCFVDISGVTQGYFAECGLRNAESCQGVICGQFDADFFCGMKGKVRNESMQNVAKMNIYTKYLP